MRRGREIGYRDVRGRVLRDECVLTKALFLCCIGQGTLSGQTGISAALFLPQAAAMFDITRNEEWEPWYMIFLLFFLSSFLLVCPSLSCLILGLVYAMQSRYGCWWVFFSNVLSVFKLVLILYRTRQIMNACRISGLITSWSVTETGYFVFADKREHGEFSRSFRAKINPTDNKTAEEELQREIRSEHEYRNVARI